MNLRDAEKLARELMAEWLDDSWRFAWGDRKRSFGTTHYREKTIKLHRTLTSLNDRTSVEDTIRHEIAHALAGASAAHGPAWKAQARKVGATPRASKDGVSIPGKYQATCGTCGRVHNRFKRAKDMTNQACGPCCKRYNGGRFTKRFLLTWVETNAHLESESRVAAARVRSTTCTSCFLTHAPGQTTCE